MTERAIETIHHPPMPVDTNETREAEDALITEMCCLNAMPTEAGPMPDRMTASELVEIELFQVRAAIFTAHVEGLRRALDHDGDLQPVLVLRRGGRAYLIDGRHRKQAYEQAGRGDNIPVAEFRGTPQEALLEGQRLNKLHTLAMTKDERMDCAWKLVKLDAAGAGRFTLPQIMAAGVSRGQVTFMRRVLRELKDGFEHESWKAAQRAHSGQPGREYTDEEIEEMIEAQAQNAADRFARIIGTRLADRPEVLARMIEIYSGRRVSEVVRILNERNESEDEFPEF